MSCKYVLWHPSLTGKNVFWMSLRVDYISATYCYWVLVVYVSAWQFSPTYASTHANKNKVQMDKKKQ